jgi:hypothetical protein
MAMNTLGVSPLGRFVGFEAMRADCQNTRVSSELVRDLKYVPFPLLPSTFTPHPPNRYHSYPH